MPLGCRLRARRVDHGGEVVGFAPFTTREQGAEPCRQASPERAWHRVAARHTGEPGPRQQLRKRADPGNRRGGGGEAAVTAGSASTWRTFLPLPSSWLDGFETEGPVILLAPFSIAMAAAASAPAAMRDRSPAGTAAIPMRGASTTNAPVACWSVKPAASEPSLERVEAAGPTPVARELATTCKCSVLQRPLLRDCLRGRAAALNIWASKDPSPDLGEPALRTQGPDSATAGLRLPYKTGVRARASTAQSRLRVRAAPFVPDRCRRPLACLPVDCPAHTHNRSALRLQRQRSSSFSPIA